jgi:hypothetical protein
MSSAAPCPRAQRRHGCAWHLPRPPSHSRSARSGQELDQAKNKKKVVRYGRSHNPNLGGWLENAIAEHQREPFRAIIAAASLAGAAPVLGTDDLDENNPLVSVAHECAIARDVESLSAALQGLLRFGSRIAFVDPFFDPYNPRHKRMFFR